MPTIDTVGPYRVFIYSSDRNEPRHVHVEREKFQAKFWLEPVRLEVSGGFSRSEINRIQRIVEERREKYVRKWNEYFDL